MTTTSNDPQTAANPNTIYHHKKRPDWGCAILLWERGNKRGYQFEDGRKRVFKRAYCHLLKPVDRPMDETAAIKKNLLARAGRRVQAAPPKTAARAIPLSAQIELFGELYAAGFRDQSWIDSKRGSEDKRRLKRHRAPLIVEARERLGRERLEQLLADGRSTEVVDTMVELAHSTDLVSKRHASSLTNLNEQAAAEIASALYDVLYATDEYAIRFERFIAVLARATKATPRWQLATLFPAIVHPSEHLFVKPNTTDVQAAWMAPRLVMTKQPNGPTYARLRDMAMTLGERLGEHGLAPRDLLDLHDFMWETLRPKARKLLVERVKQQR